MSRQHSELHLGVSLSEAQTLICRSCTVAGLQGSLGEEVPKRDSSITRGCRSEIVAPPHGFTLLFLKTLPTGGRGAMGLRRKEDLLLQSECLN